VAQFQATYDSKERVLADGRVVVPGEPFDLTSDDQKDSHNKRLIDSGQIVAVMKKKGDSS
jgi:hypothetical protein